MTSKKNVLNDRAWGEQPWIREEGGRFGVFVGKVQQINCGIYIGSGATEDKAWDDAWANIQATRDEESRMRRWLRTIRRYWRAWNSEL